MVKPPLRTKSIGFKVSEEEYALLETAAQAVTRLKKLVVESRRVESERETVGHLRT